MDGVITGAVLFGAGVLVGALVVWLLGQQYSEERAELHRVIGQMQMRIAQLEEPEIPETEL